jgi:superfamily II DNA helicase RecQ
MANSIRYQQNWYNPPITVYDFRGDEKAMMKYRAQQGVRKLSQQEKILMFGMVDKQLRDNVNEIKNMIGIEKPSKKKKGGSIKNTLVANAKQSQNQQKNKTVLPASIKEFTMTVNKVVTS